MCYLCLIALFFVRQDPDSQVFLNPSIADGNNVMIAYHDFYVFMTHTVIDRLRKLKFDEQEEVVKRNLLLEAHKKATARQIKMKRLHLEPQYLRHDPRWCSRCKDHSLKAYSMPPVPNHSLKAYSMPPVKPFLEGVFNASFTKPFLEGVFDAACKSHFLKTYSVPPVPNHSLKAYSTPPLPNHSLKAYPMPPIPNHDCVAGYASPQDVKNLCSHPVIAGAHPRPASLSLLCRKRECTRHSAFGHVEIHPPASDL